MDLDLLLARLDLILYLLGAGLAFTSVLGGRARLMRWVPILALAGWLAHGAVLLRIGFATGRLPLDQAPDRISFLAWAAVLVYVVAAWIFRMEILGVIILPLTVVLLLTSGFLPTDAVVVPERIQPGLLAFHIAVATLGVAALFLAFGSSIIYLVQERGLKAKRPGGLLVRLPSLQTCEAAGHRALLWGFPLLTLAIVTGTVWSANVRASYWMQLPRETLSLLAWALLALVLFARLVYGWRGRKAAYLTIAAFAAVLVRMLGFSFPS